MQYTSFAMTIALTSLAGRLSTQTAAPKGGRHARLLFSAVAGSHPAAAGLACCRLHMFGKRVRSPLHGAAARLACWRLLHQRGAATPGCCSAPVLAVTLRLRALHAPLHLGGRAAAAARLLAYGYGALFESTSIDSNDAQSPLLSRSHSRNQWHGTPKPRLAATRGRQAAGGSPLVAWGQMGRGWTDADVTPIRGRVEM